MNLNKVFLIGRLTNNPEVRTTPSGQMVCNFRLATNRIWNDRETQQRQEQTEYHYIVLWRRLAEIASQYLSKGSLVLIEGRIQTRSWQDQSGTKRYTTEVIADNIQLGPKPHSQGVPATANTPQASTSPAQTSRPEQQNQPKQTQPYQNSKPDEEEIPVIEEDTPPSTLADENNEEEIDVRNIPF